MLQSDKFAKLFEVGDQRDAQLLVLLQINDDGYPEVRCVTTYDGLRIEIAPAWEPADGDAEYNERRAWELAQGYFNEIGNTEAGRIHARLVESMAE